MTLKDFVNKKMTSAEKVVSAEGYPLQLDDCKKYKKMKQLEVYGKSFQDGTPSPENPIEVQHVGDLVTDETDANYGKYKIPVTQRGTNIFPENLCNKSTTTKGITVDYEGNGIFYIHGEYTNTGNSSLSFNNKMFDGLNIPIDLKAYYTLHAKVISGSCSHRVLPYLGTRDATTSASSKINWIDVPVQPGTYEEGSIFSKTVLGGYGASANATGIKQFWFYWHIGAGSTLTVDIRVQVWLTKSSTRLPYEPHVEPVTTNIFLDEPLRNITNAYNGHIAEEYMDYIDFKNKKVHRRLHEYCFDGSVSPLQLDDTVCIIDTGIVAKSTTWQSWQGLSNRFSATSYLTPYDEPFLCAANSISSKISFRNFHMIPGVTDATTLKQWLTENPVTWVFPFATPKEEPLDIELPKLNTRTTIFEIGTSLAPSNLKGKYIKR